METKRVEADLSLGIPKVEIPIEVVEKFTYIWKTISNHFNTIVVPAIKKLAEALSGIHSDILVGYKRKVKKKQRDYYESISAGKSNNWRKLRGLPLRRRKY